MSDETETPPTEPGYNVSRRDAMKLMGIAPVAGVLAWTAADVERASNRVRDFFLNNGQQQYVPKFFTAEEWRSLNILVDYIIPRDAKSGSATDAKVPEFIDFMLTDTEQNISVNNQNAWRNGLKWLDDESTRRFQRTFVTANDPQRRVILNDIAWPARAPDGMNDGVNFFNRARNMTAAGFFSSAIGWQDIGYIGNVAVPQWTGCPQPALDKLGVSYNLMNTRIRPRNG
jgi:hypothetical protein